MIFSSTRATLSGIAATAKTASLLFTLLTQTVYIGYLIYAICTGRGSLTVNAVLLSVSVAYLIFFSVMEVRLGSMSRRERRLERRRVKGVKRAYKWIKLTAKTFNLAVLLYGIYVGSESATPISTIITTLMIIVWVLEVFFASASLLVEHLVRVLAEAIEEDTRVIKESVTAPVRGVIGGFKRLFRRGGREREGAPRNEFESAPRNEFEDEESFAGRK